MTLMLQFQWPQEISPEIESNLRSSLEKALTFLEGQLARSSNINSLNERLAMLRKVQRRLELRPSSEVLAMGLKDGSVESQSRILRTLSRRGECYNHAEHLLISHLQSSEVTFAENAAICLKNYGAQASNALPQLEKAFGHPNIRVRVEASNAVSRIAVLMMEGNRVGNR